MATPGDMAATPYPFYVTGQNGTDGEAFKAALVSSTASSIERNTDSGFSAARAQAIHRDVVATSKDATIVLLTDRHASDREHARQFAELRAELAGMRASQLQAQIDGLRADAQAQTLNSILAAVKALVK